MKVFPSLTVSICHRTPHRGKRNWDGKEVAKAAVYANRRRIQGERGKRLQRQRGERIERNFAHQFDTGGLDRLYVRGRRMSTKSSSFRRRLAISRF
jgi:hypothetical protein